MVCMYEPADLERSLKAQQSLPGQRVNGEGL